ncbi:hypothetical protein P0D75_40790 [Paraburkholderia sediminicola]|uniref:hypothetical protein n=1 Tax=Paraburkholderia sediminicola TaxID=458836 RepID=UPI0038BA2E4C
MRSLHTLTGIMGKIAHASTTQTSGIEQVNHAVAEMDKVTQQNASLAEQVSSAGRSMASGASGLRDSVAVFRIGDAQEADAATHGVAAVSKTHCR